MAVVDEKRAEGLDKGRLPDARGPGKSDAQSLAGRSCQPFEKIGGGRLMIGVGGLDEGNRPRDGPPIRASYPALQPGRIGHRHDAIPPLMDTGRHLALHRRSASHLTVS